MLRGGTHSSCRRLRGACHCEVMVRLQTQQRKYRSSLARRACPKSPLRTRRKTFWHCLLAADMVADERATHLIIRAVRVRHFLVPGQCTKAFCVLLRLLLAHSRVGQADVAHHFRITLSTNALAIEEAKEGLGATADGARDEGRVGAKIDDCPRRNGERAASHDALARIWLWAVSESASLMWVR